MKSFEEYMLDVKSQLLCNISKEHLEEYGAYKYTNEEVDSHHDYFEKCRNVNLSAYKALLFFHDYLHSSKEDRQKWFKK